MNQSKQIGTLALLQILSHQCNAVSIANEEQSNGLANFKFNGALTGIMKLTMCTDDDPECALP